MAVRDILAAIAVFINGAKGYSALQLSRDLSVDYKTAFVLLHKVREAIEAAREAGALKGDVEVDGAYFGGYVKPANESADRKDRRKRPRPREPPPACRSTASLRPTKPASSGPSCPPSLTSRCPPSMVDI